MKKKYIPGLEKPKGSILVSAVDWGKGNTGEKQSYVVTLTPVSQKVNVFGYWDVLPAIS